MIRRVAFASITVLGFLAACSGGNEPAVDSTPAVASVTGVPVADVVAAMGMQNMSSVTWSGTAWRIRNNFRQTRTASPPWTERDEISSYVRTVDLAQPASLATGTTLASNIFLDPAAPGTYTQSIPADQTAWRQQLEIWLTPWGFLRGAENYGAEVGTATVNGVEYTTIRWSSPPTQTSPSGLRYTVNGYVNAAKLIERVETWVEDPFMGDQHVVAVYGDYRNVNGLMVPTVMEQQRGGGGIFGVTVADARANPANLAELLTAPAPAAGGGGGGGGGGAGAAAAPADPLQPLGEHVFLMTGGYSLLVVEFTDHLTLFEGGQTEARAEEVIGILTTRFPGKPIRYLVASHHHADHTLSFIPYVKAGATILAHASAVDFLSSALSTPRTLQGEPTLTPKFEAVVGVRVLEDANARLELHHVPTLHADSELVAYVPAARVLLTSDFPLPRPGAPTNPFATSLAAYVQAYRLDFDRYLQVHGAEATKADLMATIGR